MYPILPEDSLDSKRLKMVINMTPKYTEIEFSEHTLIKL
jgi:hypothetical protein